MQNFKQFFTAILTAAFLFFLPLTSGAKETKEKQVTLEVKIGQMLMLGFRGKLLPEGTLSREIRDGKVGGVVLFGLDVGNNASDSQFKSPLDLRQVLKTLGSEAPIPLFIATDYEGGKISRMKKKSGFAPTPSHHYLGTKNDISKTYSHAAAMSRRLSELGFNMNLAPVVDLNINPDNPVIAKLERSFSGDPEVVTAHAGKFVEASRRYGIISVLKHFPGHGSSKGDSHKGMTDVTKSWSKKELRPFANLIKSGHADAIMTAHIINKNIDPDYPATLSKATITGILREKMGYEGLVISDDLLMKAISDNYGLEKTVLKAIEAGVDILLFSNHVYAEKTVAEEVGGLIKKFIRKGRISENRINASYKRIMKLKNKLYPGGNDMGSNGKKTGPKSP